MILKQFAYKLAEESSIHGLPYLLKRNIHWTEKVFWGLVVSFAAYSSISICLNQWERFRERPTVFALELLWDKKDFPIAGVTQCSNYFDTATVRELIDQMWQVREETNPMAFEHYMEFLKVLNVLNINNLKTLQPFENDEQLTNLNFIQILLQMRQKILPDGYLETNCSKDDKDIYTVMPREFGAAITEFGLCETTSELMKYTNPYENRTKLPSCRFGAYCDRSFTCNIKLMNQLDRNTILYLFLHNANDILAPFDKGADLNPSPGGGSLNLDVYLSLNTAETEVHNIPIDYRKCRYNNENNLKYYEEYRPSLCRIECRINTAVQKCGCKPFFYVVAPHLPICDIKGMLCLDKANWPNVTQCNCYNMCEDVQYTTNQKNNAKNAQSFSQSIILTHELPDTAMKRRVIFSMDQLIMSFGGAIGLFLGASFISIYSLIYTTSEFMMSNVWSWLKPKQCKQQNKYKKSKRPAEAVPMAYIS